MGDMKVICEVSRPHYHPGPSFAKKVTKKRDLSVPPHWVAHERIEKDGISYAIVMPPRQRELYEVEQEPHIHIPQYVTIEINGHKLKAKVKVEPHAFNPRVHFDDKTAAQLGINNGDVCEAIV
ncbi:MAG: hypothetical protein RL681_121 [Candidatus Parcubacteria bacterium]|jgi:hypothetical protein